MFILLIMEQLKVTDSKTGTDRAMGTRRLLIHVMSSAPPPLGDGFMHRTCCKQTALCTWSCVCVCVGGGRRLKPDDVTNAQQSAMLITRVQVPLNT